MKKKTFAFLLSSLTVLVASVTAFNLAGGNFIKYFALGSRSASYSVSITRTATFTGNYSTVSNTIVTTDGGNQLEFGGEHFDIRNSGSKWHNCLVFCASKGATRFWNKTELYSISSIKIYNYDADNPDSYASLSGSSFTFFYGYELIDFDDEYYVAKETTTSGKIEFASGYEPSYFGIEGDFANDVCVSKIEVNYLCQQVAGELVTNIEEPRLYDASVTTFEYANGNSVVVSEQSAPLARETEALNHAKGSWYNASSYDPTTKSWTTSRDDYITIDRADSKAFPARDGRDTMLVTFTVSKEEGFTGWSGAGDVWIGVNRSASTAECLSRFYTENPTAGAQSWVVLSNGFEIHDTDTGTAMTTPIWDVKVVVEFDVSTVDNIYNLSFGTSHAFVKFTIHDISFRDNCTHEHTENHSTGYSFAHKCYRCGKFLDHFVDSLEYKNFSGLSSDNFTYETGVTFDGVEKCLKTTTNIKTNYAEGGHSQNYQLRFLGLIANARAAGLMTIKFDTYIESSTNFNTRFQWGLWDTANNRIHDFALFDHYNGPTDAGYNGTLAVDMVTSITNLDGTSAGSEGRPNSAHANRWITVTMDVSSNEFANMELFFSPAFYFDDCGTYPINIYFANFKCLPYSRLLVENSVMKYDIKANNDSDSLEAADKIHDYIYAATNKNITVSTLGSNETVSKDSKTIIIGSTTIAASAGISFSPSTDKGTFLLKTSNNNVFFIANNSDGYLLGAHKFAELILGYDHYGKDTYSYDYVSNNIAIPYIDLQHTTAFKYRRCDDSDFTWSDGDCLSYNSGNWSNKNPLITVNGVQKYHNSTLIIDPDTYKSSHPKWYSQNKYGITSTNQLCYTARGNSSEYNALVNETADKIIELFASEANLEKDTLCFGMADNVEYCHCSACSSAASGYGGALSGTIVKFLNDVYDVISPRISETNRSEIYLTFLAYYEYEEAPTNITCNDHVGVIVAPIQANYTEAINSSSNYSEFGSLFSAWSTACSKIDTWLYETNFGNYLYPLNSFEATTKSISYLASLGSISVIYTQGQHNVNAPRTGFNALKRYLNSKFMDNPDSNFDDLVDKFFAHYYGEGGATMRTFFDELVTKLEYNEANYSSILYQDNRKSIGQNIADSRLWDVDQLRSWVSLCETARNEATSTVAKTNILVESIFPRFALCSLFASSYSSSELRALRQAFKDDCTTLGITPIIEIVRL